MKNKDVVIVGLQSWDLDIGSNCKNIALEISKNNRVLYVNSPLDRSTVFKNKSKPEVQKRLKILKGEEDCLVKINENMWNLFPKTVLESVSQLKPDFLFNVLNKVNNKRFAKQIKYAIERLGFKNIILFNDGDMYRSFYLKELLNPELYIYYSRDNFVVVDYWKAHGQKMESELMKKADLIVSNSTYLAEIGKKYNKHSFYVGQGCDISQFNESLINFTPEDIAPIKKPVIGYVGALYSLRLDLDLLQFIAGSNPEWSLVLVGPEDTAFKNSDLHKMNNVYFLGQKNPNELPAYVKAFDVCINPQILNEVTIGNYPRKIDEYLAMGKPVIATKTKAMSIFSDYTYQPVTKEEYIEAIRKVLKDINDSSEQERIIKRKAFAASHTWENNVNEIYNSINKVLK
jgi:teichuronic acid biosynthesis glycosyltransferase TuaH